MLKPSKTVQKQEPGLEGLFQELGVINYLSDLSSPTPALESMNNGDQSVVVTVGKERPPETTVIDKKDGVYYIYLHVDEISVQWWATNINSFTQWIMSLNKNDTIVINQTGTVRFIPSILQALVVLDTMCLARKIFSVDHIIETPLFLLVCDVIMIADTGAISFTNCIDDDNVRKVEQILLPQIRRLYTRAVTKGLLTEGEVNSILNDNAIVFKTARQLRQATMTS